MAYRIADVDVTRPLPMIRLSRHENGLAVLFRRDGRPLDFQVHPLASGARIDPERLAAMTREGAAVRLVEGSLRMELTQPPSPVQRPSVTVAVCTRDRPEDLRRCLQSLLSLQ